MLTKRLTRIAVDVLWDYREFKRDEVPAPRIPMVCMHDVVEITEYVEEHGIEPLELSIIGDKALLTDGNHRIVAAKKLGYADVPVNVVVYFGDPTENLYDHTINRFKTINEALELCLKKIFL